jgi:hypothetical protein
MNVRAKFYVTRSSELGNCGAGRQEIMKPVSDPDSRRAYTYEKTGIPVREITLSAVYDDGLAKENKSFADATPSGSLTFYLNNPNLADEFKPGDVYYLDFTKAS